MTRCRDAEFGDEGLAIVVDLRHVGGVPGPDHVHLTAAVAYVVRPELEREMREWCQVQAARGFLRIVTTDRHAATTWAKGYRGNRALADPEGDAMRQAVALIARVAQG